MPAQVAATVPAPAPEQRSQVGNLPGPGGQAGMHQDPFALPPMADAPVAPPQQPRSPPSMVVPVVAVQQQKSAKAPAERQGRSLVQRLTSVAAHLVVVAVLVVGLVAVGSAWLNEGRVDLASLSPSRMRELVAPTRTLVARELSNGLYETREGRPVFFVRGEAENRGNAPARVVARVSMYDGEQRVQSAEGLAGAVPTPEEFYSLSDAKSATALRARLDAEASEVAPGARVPFIVFFHEYPEGLADFRLEVALDVATQEVDTANAKP
jgi:hypothetical protein